MFGLLSTLNWEFEKLLFTEDLGRVFVYVGLGLMFLGVLVIRKIIDIRV
jgi:Flp pilus assembly protein TadB